MLETDQYVEQADKSRRPMVALLLLGSGTLVWYFCGPLQRNAVSLISDVLLTFVCSLGLVGVLCRHLRLAIPVDPLEWQVSADAANAVAACLANTVGAAEGVLRVAASGSDSKLFSKGDPEDERRAMNNVQGVVCILLVVIVLCITSAIGRAATGATIAYIVLWFIFIIAMAVGKLAPDSTYNPPTFLQKKLISIGNCPSGTSPRVSFSG